MPQRQARFLAGLSTVLGPPRMIQAPSDLKVTSPAQSSAGTGALLGVTALGAVLAVACGTTELGCAWRDGRASSAGATPLGEPSADVAEIAGATAMGTGDADGDADGAERARPSPV